MRFLRKIVVIVLILGLFWFFYGNTYQQSGVTGVIDEIQTDINKIKDNPKVKQGIVAVQEGAKELFNSIFEEKGNDEQQQQPKPEKPELDAPAEQSFSVHNIEIGDYRDQVETQTGKPKRSSFNEYGVDWTTYHENYHNFFMVAYDNANDVAGLYTNQDLIVSTYDIKIGTSKKDVQNQLPEALTGIQKGHVNYRVKNDGEFDTFLIDQNYVTIFYDKHENNSVTAIQIISEELENRKEGMFGEPSGELKEGFEYQLFDLTNAERVTHGLSVLNWDDGVRQTARSHSADMAENHYFNHTNQQGLSPSGRMERDGIAFRGAGENIASGQMSSIFAHEGLMNSLGHRENILHRDYQFLAIGVAFDDEKTPYYTENFVIR
ncbi:serine protease [Cerasibacillus terrae]|uniref:Serine protease n=1 Tax=Cerasibacillus terrae TaxID=2498845 RepID=A0A5C8NZQ6_9BACI|nr:CAP-associated domain-containing protein [Cerasibacillus terrae]TXL66809.1 serine protease [Cerasibacillus terrae]